jgi:polyhydroxyalkanoate synthesis repressor PhaR
MEQPGEGRATEPETVEITRYPNRRLYDRSRGRYVTLQEITETVREGKTVAVRDRKTGEDLTRSVLIQIILERHPERMELLPVAVLHCMIRADAGVLGFLGDYFRQSLVHLEMLQRSAAINPFARPLDWMRFFLPNPAPPQDKGESAAPLVGGPDAGVLARRVAELEKRLDQMKASAGKAGPKKRARGKSPGRGKRGAEAASGAP